MIELSRFSQSSMKCDTSTVPFLIAVLTLSSLTESYLRSPANCFQSITVDTGDDQFCSRRVNQSTYQLLNFNDAIHWQYPDLQSALVAAVNLSLSPVGENSRQQDSVCIEVPPGDHTLSAPIHFSNASVSLFGTGEEPDDVTIVCNYSVDVNESRIYDMDYDYTDYTFYFNRSEVVSFEGVQFVDCPYPLRLDTVATVRVCNSIFR